MKRSRLKHKSKRPLAKLKAEAWRVFSIWVRQNGMNKDGMNYCYTCGRLEFWKRLQAGHFVSRTHNATFIDEMNVKPQCFSCNIWKRGEGALFAEHLIKDYGIEKFSELIARSRTTKQFTVKELEALIKKYEIQDRPQ